MTDTEGSDDEEVVKYDLQSLSEFGYSKVCLNLLHRGNIFCDYSHQQTSVVFLKNTTLPSCKLLL